MPAAERSSSINCDPIAAIYKSVEYLCFGLSLERRRFAFLAETCAAKRALLCGGGDGRFLERLLRSNAHIQVDFVDLSQKMISLARRRVGALSKGQELLSRVHFYHADVRDFAPSEAHYDLIAAHFFLDCFSNLEIEEIVHRLRTWASPQALLLVSEFSEGTAPIRVWNRLVIRGLYAAFRLTTGLRVARLPDYRSALVGAGFHLLAQKSASLGLLHSSIWQLPVTT